MRHADRFLAPMLALATAAAPVAAAADYTCQKIDVPGSTGTQIWQINDRNQMAAGSSLGGYVYDPASDPPWHPIPAPPADSGFVLEQLSALGINDAGVIAGPAGPGDGSWSRGFILTGSTYEFFQYGSWTHTEPRAISDGGLVTGWAWEDDGTNVAFVYNPGADVPGYPHGFTEAVPMLPDGTRSSLIIPGAMNGAGQFVGSANFWTGGKGVRFGFLYDPAWQDHGYAQQITLFQIEGRYTAPRGINDSGQVVGFTRDASGAMVGFLQTSAGYQFITCPELADAAAIWLESIDDVGVISGSWTDTNDVSHGLVAYPNVALPVTSQDGAYVFDVAVAPDTPVFLDPAVAVGYRYALGDGDPRFASVTLPIGVGDGAYTVYAEGRAFPVAGGQELEFAALGFPAGIARFTVLGIEPGAGLNPGDPAAFVTEVAFAGSGRFTGSMTPLTAGDVLADLLQAVSGVGPGRSLAAKVRSAGAAYAAGDVPLACSALVDLAAEVAAQGGKKLDAALAAAIAPEARDTMAALGCP